MLISPIISWYPLEFPVPGWDIPGDLGVEPEEGRVWRNGRLVLMGRHKVPPPKLHLSPGNLISVVWRSHLIQEELQAPTWDWQPSLLQRVSVGAKWEHGRIMYPTFRPPARLKIMWSVGDFLPPLIFSSCFENNEQQRITNVFDYRVWESIHVNIVLCEHAVKLGLPRISSHEYTGSECHCKATKLILLTEETFQWIKSSGHHLFRSFKSLSWSFVKSQIDTISLAWSIQGYK